MTDLLFTFAGYIVCMTGLIIAARIRIPGGFA